jgi:hypothetical protein
LIATRILLRAAWSETKVAAGEYYEIVLSSAADKNERGECKDHFISSQ